uniref:Uncharacterized protein AlNc14C57G4306 n=1 Tax=Albugo laibachii Nc14 TaxID=890382 RepID=F0WCC6_9STRA|nr:conserved hypothetical protein [Albugo laibachii Nc14]|eukprot:CCA18841.1 conserved hypothetical protein [Albugo laibachii Nc14]
MRFCSGKLYTANSAWLVLLHWEIYGDAWTEPLRWSSSHNPNRMEPGGNSVGSFIQPFSKADFFEKKARQKLLCYYNLETPDERGYLKNHALPQSGASLALTSCLFGDLELNVWLVKNLLQPQVYRQNCTRRTQLGLSLHSSSDSTHNASNTRNSTVQMKSAGTPFGSEIYPQALYNVTAMPLIEEKLSGITFELAFRRHSKSKEVLFTIQNDFDACSGLGFQLHINEHSMLVLSVKQPSMEFFSECNEMKFRSASSVKKCVLPTINETVASVDIRPVIHVFITFRAQLSLNGIVYNAHFFIDYLSSTKTHYTCDIQDEQVAILNDTSASMDVTYRLYVGTGPTDEMKQKYPSSGIRPRIYRDPRAIEMGNLRSAGIAENNAILQLRKTIQHVLDSIEGPRIPAAARLFGHRAFSLQVLGWKFPAVNEDTPFAWIRDKIKQFKEAHGTQVVDILVNMLLKAARLKSKLMGSTSGKLVDIIGERLGVDGTENATAENQSFEQSTFDLFAFGLYGQVLSEEEVKESMAHLLPTRASLTSEITANIQSDSWMLVDFTTMSSVFKNICIEVLDPLPEPGKLVLWPSNALIATESGQMYREFVDGRHISSEQLCYVPDPSKNSRWEIDPSILFAQCKSERMLPSTICDRGKLDFIPVEENPFKKAINDLRDELNDNISGAGRLALEREKRGGAIGRMNLHLTESPTSSKTIHRELGYDIVAGVPTMVHIRDETVDVNESSQFEWKRSRLRLRVITIPQIGTLYDTDNLDLNPGCTHIRLGSEINFLARWEKRRITIAHAQGYQGIQRNPLKNQNFTTSLLYLYPRTLPSLLAGPEARDELLYELFDRDDTIVERGRVTFHLPSSTISLNASSVHRESWIQLEDTISLMDLSGLLPACESIQAERQLRILSLPQHGRLYQYISLSNASRVDEKLKEQEMAKITSNSLPTPCGTELLENVGRKIQVNDTVVDPFGRIIFIPEIDYFDQPSSRTTPFASALYEKSIFSPSKLNFTFAAMLNSKSKDVLTYSEECLVLVDIQVIDTDDAIMPTSPFRIRVLRTENKTVSFPIRFVDPDEPREGESRRSGMLYLIHIVSEELDAEFRFPSHEEVDDDKIYKNCFSRKLCRLPSGLSLRYDDVSGRMSNDSSAFRIYFLIQKSLYTPYDVYFIGHLPGIQSALKYLQILDYSRKWRGSHTSEFTVSFTRWKMSLTSLIPHNNTRDDGSNTAQKALQVMIRTRPNVMARFAVEFEASPASEAAGTQFSGIYFGWYAFSIKAQRVLSKILIVLFLLQTAGYVSCCRTCCICSRRRREKRMRCLQRKFSKHFDKVVRDDIEYSLLIVQLADVIIASDFIVAKAIIRACVHCSDHREAKRLISLCLHNLLPILSTAQRDDDFLLDLLQHELALTRGSSINRPEDDYVNLFSSPSAASLALAIYFHTKASTWIKIVLNDLAEFLDESDIPPPFHETMTCILGILQRHYSKMPIGLVLHKAVRIVLESLKICDANMEEEDKFGVIQFTPSWCQLYLVTHIFFFNHLFGLCLLEWKQYIDGSLLERWNNKPTQIEDTLRSVVNALHQMASRWSENKSFNSESRIMCSEVLVGTIEITTGEMASWEHSYCFLLKKIALLTDTTEIGKRAQPMAISKHLMNIHSILDCRWSFFLTECTLQAAKCSSLSQMPMTYLQHLEALIRALDIPYASTDDLLSAHHDPWESFPCGYSVNAWREKLKYPAA